MLNELAAEIHQNAVDKGFWNKERNMGEMLMLMTSELAEALEEHRDGKPNFYVYSVANGTHHTKVDENTYLIRTSDFKAGHKPEGVAVELADCLIRILDTMQSLGVDIDAVVQAKMAYNNSREHMHGKAY